MHRIAALFLLTAGLALPASGADMPLRLLPGLQSITFFESTSSATPDDYTFAAGGNELTTRLDDPLSFSNSDFCGVCTGSGEYFDVFYSDADGTFNLDGRYVTVEAVWDRALPTFGGGLNLAEVRLDFADGDEIFADVVASFVALGNSALPERVGRAVDGDLLTHATMGNTVGQTERLRVTVGFPVDADAPIRLLPGLQSITFFESTSSVTPDAHEFAPESVELTTRLDDPLSFSRSDFCGVCTGSGEYFDVFYSDADGTFNLDGHYVTVEAVWDRALPTFGGGLNLAEVRLNFAGGAQVFTEAVASFVALGNSALPERVGRAVDGDLLTHTTMGNTVGQTERLRVTVGFQGIFCDGFESGDTSVWSSQTFTP